VLLVVLSSNLGLWDLRRPIPGYKGAEDDAPPSWPVDFLQLNTVKKREEDGGGEQSCGDSRECNVVSSVGTDKPIRPKSEVT